MIFMTTHTGISSTEYWFLLSKYLRITSSFLITRLLVHSTEYTLPISVFFMPCVDFFFKDTRSSRTKMSYWRKIGNDIVLRLEALIAVHKYNMNMYPRLRANSQIPQKYIYFYYVDFFGVNGALSIRKQHQETYQEVYMAITELRSLKTADLLSFISGRKQR
ncbi:hypothetical protein PHYBLDRAFT_174626 [Phycomyces blakesleeanus NRRL 1555(-)]|uniref:Uncharacterized protein n=1 Tax=Phycomyces blakesleeanus (strain ATCC 8743b / DSM 1359 / FGSC 10004 / NBRC 33097 / NRRL 1555) TaxID=763407 RepID=A0A162TGB4_PHYB8|nr:hypothetical protein PHYBLDRAFT_174626 [Phycomyces blakesleeanus NRRL 1555(-)]OAD66913.1 hypothetical protein PHYBLDRAFT_174626 [Phycomyces blakesleeanus NRRL 1555(-)]|eukprot:XP_018284953.1 hypothetical protein PHYBLDRAFT_174626 [Phycomyces blakesleeanus NRRL 1555(-)]